MEQSPQTQEQLAPIVAARLKAIIQDKTFGNETLFARTVGLNQTTLNNYCAGRRLPALEALVQIVEHFPDLNCEWLLKGKGQMYTDPDKNPPPAPQPVPQQTDNYKALYDLKCREVERLTEDNARLNSWVDLLMKKAFEHGTDQTAV